MKLNNTVLYGIITSLSLTACVRTFGSNYYAQKAYSAFGLKTPKTANPNVMPYIPGDKKAMEKIAAQTPSAPQTASATPPQAQYQPYPLNNTSNYSTADSARAINSVHVANEYYSQYLKELGKYYNQYGEIFAAKNMPSDAQLLQAKGATATSGNDVMFETENSFDIPLDKKSIITSQRKVLENVKSRTEVLKEMPSVVAQLQASFDCMIIEAKNRIYSQKTVCGMAYFQSLSVVEARFGSMNEPPKSETFAPVAAPDAIVEQSLSPAPTSEILPSPISAYDTPSNPAVIPSTPSRTTIGTGGTGGAGGAVVNNINITLGEDAKPKPKEKISHYAKYKDEFEDKAVLKYDNHKSFVVYYDVGSFALDSSAIYSINKAIEFTRDYDDYKITVLGFTDKTSSRDYNKVLSEKRATAVFDALIKRGIKPEKMKKVFFGEDYNSVLTRDGVGEAFNRRVVIEVDVTGNFDEEEFIETTTQAEEDGTMK